MWQYTSDGDARFRHGKIEQWRIVKAKDVRIEDTRSKKQIKLNANDNKFALAA